MATTTTYSIIYSFGDSLSDAGDAYQFTATYGQAFGTSAQPVSPPYAQETYGSVKADVFSNGPVWVQDLAIAFGLANPGPGQVGGTGAQLMAAGVPGPVVAGIEAQQGSPGNNNAYLTLVPATGNGTDFAIGGSITGPTGFNTDGAAALTDLASQIASFQNQTPTPLNNALYTVWSGSNDVLNLLASSTITNTTAAQNDVAQSAQNEVNAVISLAGLGAKTVLVANVPNLGLIPKITAQPGFSPVATAYSQLFNNDLMSDLTAASGQLAGVSVKVLDDFTQLTGTTPGTVVPGPNGNTITNTTNSAYTGSFTKNDGTEVPNPNNYLYFDALHPTQTGHQALANLAATTLAAACYCAGTAIATPLGPVPVETLREGDLVLTASGASRPVRWIGRRSYASRFLLRNRAMLPVRFAAGSLGGGVPVRDLLVSPEHAMVIDGWLIPARELVNGVTITAVPHVAAVHYFHVELDSHDVLLAEGAPSESFMDDDSRASFHNVFEYWAKHGEDAVDPVFCLPRLTEGHALDAIRNRLDQLAAA